MIRWAAWPRPAGMALPIQYSLRNDFVRWRSTLATVLGIADRFLTPELSTEVEFLKRAE